MNEHDQMVHDHYKDMAIGIDPNEHIWDEFDDGICMRCGNYAQKIIDDIQFDDAWHYECEYCNKKESNLSTSESKRQYHKYANGRNMQYENI